MNKITASIYEIRDITSEEMFFPLGIFLTLEEAKSQINLYDEYTAISDTGAANGFHEVISIMERPLGMSGNGQEVYRLEREEVIDENLGEATWETKSWDVTDSEGEPM